MVCFKNKNSFSLLTTFKMKKINDYKTQYTTYYFV
jgi:hypothetical protein